MYDEQDIERVRKSLEKIEQLFSELRGEIMKNDRRSRDQKIADALAKQGAEGSPYATYRNQPTGGVGFWNHHRHSFMKDLVKQEEQKKPEYYTIDNLIFPTFRKRKKPKLIVNHRTGKISTSE